MFLLGSPSSRGLGHRPFTAVTGVRIPLGTPLQSVMAKSKPFKYRSGIKSKQSLMHTVSILIRHIGNVVTNDS